MNFNFSYVLQQPFRLLWKNKRLVLLNLPNSLAGAVFVGIFPLAFVMPFLLMDGSPFDRLIDDLWPIFALAIGGFIVLTLITAPLSILTSTALIRGVAALEAGQTPGGLRTLLCEALPYFWRVAGVTALQASVGFLFAALPALLIVLTAGVAVICLGPLMPFTTPLIFVLSLVGLLAIHIIVVEDTSVVNAIKNGWQAFKKTWLSLILVFLIISQVGGMILGVLFILPSFGLIPFFIVFANGDPQTALIPVSIGIAALGLFMPVMVLGMMVFTTYTQMAMALLYLEVRKIVPALPYAASATTS
ncbi:MAG: hypothetical protein Fur0022_14610 [Anaerolineales bacterium]